MRGARAKAFKVISAFLIGTLILSGCAKYRTPYAGINPENPQFERGISVPPLDFFGDLISKLPQLFLWNPRYGNHSISKEIEAELAEFIKRYGLKDVHVRINQWAPHKEIGRLIVNKNIAWPYKILFFPSTLITSIIARPFSGLLMSDYYDPGSNTINIFSGDTSIALHEAGHAVDFSRQEYKGTYGLARLVTGVNLFQEGMATDEAIFYLEQSQRYEELLQSYKVLYPAYATYVSAYISVVPFAYFGALLVGHWVGRSAAADKKWQLETEGKIQSAKVIKI